MTTRQMFAFIGAAALGVMALHSPVLAQQKTAKTCQEEWRANKAANQANGITEKAYVATCRGGAETPSAAPAGAATAAPVAPAAPAPDAAPAARKTAKACADEWRANKAANQASGLTQKAYVDQCRNGGAPAAAAPAAPAAPSAAAPPAPTRTAVPAAPAPATPATTTPAPAAPAATAPRPAPTARTAPPAAGEPAGANQFATEAQAKARCPADTVVWVNLESKIYHFGGTRNYGRTKNGAYMCEADTAAEGMRAAKNETHP